MLRYYISIVSIFLHECARLGVACGRPCTRITPSHVRSCFGCFCVTDNSIPQPASLLITRFHVSLHPRRRRLGRSHCITTRMCMCRNWCNTLLPHRRRPRSCAPCSSQMEGETGYVERNLASQRENLLSYLIVLRIAPFPPTLGRERPRPAPRHRDHPVLGIDVSRHHWR